MQSLDDSSYKEKLRELNVLSLEDMRENKNMIQVYKILYRVDNVENTTWFNIMGDNA